METQEPVKEKKVSKYAKQIEYDRQRRLNDPEYRAKKNALSNRRNKERYQNDPEFHKKVNQNVNDWNKKVRAFYKEHKDNLKDYKEILLGSNEKDKLE